MSDLEEHIRGTSERKAVADRLTAIAEAAEELHALLLDKEPTQAAYYEKVANRSRSNATCMRLHGALPVLRTSPVAEAVRAASQFQKGIASVSRLIPKDKK